MSLCDHLQGVFGSCCTLAAGTLATSQHSTMMRLLKTSMQPEASLFQGAELPGIGIGRGPGIFAGGDHKHCFAYLPLLSLHVRLALFWECICCTMACPKPEHTVLRCSPWQCRSCTGFLSLHACAPLPRTCRCADISARSIMAEPVNLRSVQHMDLRAFIHSQHICLLTFHRRADWLYDRLRSLIVRTAMLVYLIDTC